MLITVPNYYNQFVCVADKCEDTCCAGWKIVIDSKTRKKYKKYQGEFKKRIKASVDFRESTFKQNNKRCAFLNDENLCDLYTHAGSEYLCNTCKRYPRHIEEFENLREISLSLSCPQVAKIILSMEKKVKFLTLEKEYKSDSYDDFDFFLFTKLMDARELAFSILQNRSISIYERISIVLGLIHDIQSRIDNGELHATDDILEKYKKDDAVEKLRLKLKQYQKREGDRFVIMKDILVMLDALEVLDPEWRGFLCKARERLYLQGFSNYKKNQEAFEELYKDKEYEFEQLAIYFVYTYFCGAVYDEDAYSKMKLALMSVIIIRELFVAEWMMTGELTFEDQVRICYRYSREVEHSDVNLNLLEEIMCEEMVFKLDNMLICMMSVPDAQR